MLSGYIEVTLQVIHALAYLDELVTVFSMLLIVGNLCMPSNGGFADYEDCISIECHIFFNICNFDEKITR